MNTGTAAGVTRQTVRRAMTITGSVISRSNAENWKGRSMNKELENKIGHQKREIAALKDKVARLQKHCLELQHQNAEYKYTSDQTFRILGGVK